MKGINRMPARVVTDDEGAGLFEHVLLMGLMALVGIFAVTRLGTAVSDGVSAVDGQLNAPLRQQPDRPIHERRDIRLVPQDAGDTPLP